MHHFWNIIIEPVLTMLGPEVVVEIGSDQGENTIRLLEFCKNNNAVTPRGGSDFRSLMSNH